ncbi:MAG TPA: asparagine synthase C-terminal domain-containing protein, partial [Phycisphaerales bacterium]|nr:asparagine synthase C-terminal domain-containing protein [Phycisphaerales bacterium]
VRLIGQMRVPFGDSSLLPSYWVSRAAHGAVGVALGGDGGDELFGGYDRYRAAGLAALRAPGARFVAGLLERGARPGSRRARAARLLHAGAGDGYPDLVSVFPGHELARLFPAARPAPPTGARPASADEAIAWDVRWYLPHDLLRKTDSASMACPIEVRSPFLDSNLAGLALRARLESLMPGGERKGLLRAVARRHLPAALADRPKRGFAIPVGRWLREDFGGLGTLLRDRLASTEPFGPPALGIDPDRRRVQALVREHMGGVRDHAQRLYLLLVLSLWAERMGRVLAGKAE